MNSRLHHGRGPSIRGRRSGCRSNSLCLNDGGAKGLILSGGHHKTTDHQRYLTVDRSELNLTNDCQHAGYTSLNARATNSSHTVWRANVVAGGAGEFANNIGHHMAASDVHLGLHDVAHAGFAEGELGERHCAAFFNAQRIAVDAKIQINMRTGVRSDPSTCRQHLPQLQRAITDRAGKTRGSLNLFNKSVANIRFRRAGKKGDECSNKKSAQGEKCGATLSLHNVHISFVDFYSPRLRPPYVR